jgi:triosephosphate isomerase
MNRKYRKIIIAGNWKMNKLASEVKPYFDELRAAMPKTRTCEIVICAPFTALPAAVKAGKEKPGGHLRSGRFRIQGRRVYRTGFGRNADRPGCPVCDRRTQRTAHAPGETDSQVNVKVQVLLKNGMIPIICVGEKPGGS